MTLVRTRLNQTHASLSQSQPDPALNRTVRSAHDTDQPPEHNKLNPATDSKRRSSRLWQLVACGAWAWLMVIGGAAIAQTEPDPSPFSSSGQGIYNPFSTSLGIQDQGIPTTHGVLYVDPAAGDNQFGDGTAQSPFKTITHALQVAQPNVVILLAPGIYSARTGERFPLQLRPQVTLQGAPGFKNGSAVIYGGGDFLSPTQLQQNATLLGADSAGLAGVTVTNPNSQGFGLWIESASPTVMSNIFTNSAARSIFVTGNSNPRIESNSVNLDAATPQAQELSAGTPQTGRPTPRPIVAVGSSESIVTPVQARVPAPGTPVAGPPQTAVSAQTVNLKNVPDGAAVELVTPVIQPASPSRTAPQPLPQRSPITPAPQPEPASTQNIEPNQSLGPSTSTVTGSSAQVQPTDVSQTVAAAPQRSIYTVTATSPTPAATGQESETAIRWGDALVQPLPQVQPVQPNPQRQPDPLSAAVAQPATQPSELPVLAPQTKTTTESTSAKPESTNIKTPLSQTRPAPEPLASRAERPAAVPQASPAQSLTPAIAADRAATPTSNQLAAKLPEPQTPVVQLPLSQPPVSEPPEASPDQPAIPAVEIQPRRAAEQPQPKVSEEPQEPQTEAARSEAPKPQASTPRLAIPRAVRAKNNPVTKTSTVAPKTAARDSSQAVKPPQPAPRQPQIELAALSPDVPDPKVLADVLPVPDIQQAPLGNVGSLPTVTVPRTVTDSNGGPPLPPSRAEVLGFRYRVFVNARTDKQKKKVKSVVPDAFRTVIDGRTVMQVGAFRDRPTAEERVDLLRSSGIKANIHSSE